MWAYRDLGQSLAGGTWYKTESGPELRLDSGQVAFGPDDPALASCPDVAELEEALRKMVREEVAKLGRGGEEPSLFTPEDWRNLYAGLAMHALIPVEFAEVSSRDNVVGRAYDGAYVADAAARQAEDLLARLSLNPALRPEPPEEHVAPDTASFNRREP
jgi:hypothetical protein